MFMVHPTHPSSPTVLAGREFASRQDARAALLDSYCMPDEYATLAYCDECYRRIEEPWGDVCPCTEQSAKEQLMETIVRRRDGSSICPAGHCYSTTRAVLHHRHDLYQADLRGLALRAADLAGAYLYEADLSNATLAGATLAGANLQRAQCQGVNLTGANLTDANLWGACLREANLTGANLTDANLWGACLREANLAGADLTGADMRSADLREATLTGAILTGVAHRLGITLDPTLPRRVLEQITQHPEIWDQGNWHCDTTHCVAGWAVTLAGPLGRFLETQWGPSVAATLLLWRGPTVPVPNFNPLADKDKVLRQLTALAEIAETDGTDE